MSYEFDFGEGVFYFGKIEAAILADEENFIKDKEKYINLLKKYKKIQEVYDELYSKKEKTSSDKLLLEKCYSCISETTSYYCRAYDLEALESRYDFYDQRAMHEGLAFPHESIEYDQIRWELNERKERAKIR